MKFDAKINKFENLIEPVGTIKDTFLRNKSFIQKIAHQTSTIIHKTQQQ